MRFSWRWLHCGTIYYMYNVQFSWGWLHCGSIYYMYNVQFSWGWLHCGTIYYMYNVQFSWGWLHSVYALIRVLFWCLFPSLLHNSGYKHQNTLSRAHKRFSPLAYIHCSIYLYRYSITAYISWSIFFIIMYSRVQLPCAELVIATCSGTGVKPFRAKYSAVPL